MSIDTSNNKIDEIDDIDDYEVKIYDYEEDDYVLFNSHGINLNLLNTTINTNTNINSLDSRYKFLTGENHHSLKDNFYYCYACNKKLLICEQEYTNFFIDNIDKIVNPEWKFDMDYICKEKEELSCPQIELLDTLFWRRNTKGKHYPRLTKEKENEQIKLTLFLRFLRGSSEVPFRASFTFFKCFCV